MSERFFHFRQQVSQLSFRFWLVIICFIGTLFFFLFQGGKLASMTFIIVLVLSAYLLLGKWSGVARTKAERVLSGVEQEAVVEAGTSLAVELRIQVPGLWPIPYLMIKDYLIRRGHVAHVFESSMIPDWYRKGTVEYRTPPLRRGLYQFGRLECSTGDIFGIFEHKGNVKLPQTFCVTPQTVPIKEWKQLHRMLKGMHHHAVSTLAHRETTQINGVREYLYGDRISRIHWNATAKTGTWKSKEFERESLPKTLVVLDRCKSHYTDAEQFELAVSVAASLFVFGERNKLAVGLISTGADSQFFEPKNGRGHHQSIFTHLTDVEADGSYSLMQVLSDRSRSIAAGTFLVIVSPRTGSAMQQALAWGDDRQMNPCHMWVSPAGTEESRAKWIRQLEQMGVPVYPIRQLSELPVALGGRHDVAVHS